MEVHEPARHHNLDLNGNQVANGVGGVARGLRGAEGQLRQGQAFQRGVGRGGGLAAGLPAFQAEVEVGRGGRDAVDAEGVVQVFFPQRVEVDRSPPRQTFADEELPEVYKVSLALRSEVNVAGEGKRLGPSVLDGDFDGAAAHVKDVAVDRV